MGGHKGVSKTFTRLRQNYYWPGLKKQVQAIIGRCLICQQNKLVRCKTKQPMVLMNTPGSSFDKVAMDMVGPLPRTKSVCEYILTMQDLLSKFCILTPMMAISSIDIADAFLKRLVYTHGAPKAVLTDQGSNFTSTLMRNIAKLCKLKHYTTTAFRPQSNGSIKRMHHSLKEYLKIYITGIREWDAWCECAAFSYNTSVHEGTKVTPFECVYGRLARVPSCLETIDSQVDESYAAYIANLKEKLGNIQAVARDNLTRAKQRSKEYYDHRLNMCQFKVGDKVMLMREPKKSKFSPEYSGPHRVLEVADNSVNVRISYRKGTRLVHANKLRRTHLPDDGDSSN